MITTRSTYDQAIAEIEVAVKETLADAAYSGVELSEDEVWCDMAAALLIDANRSVAEEVCKFQLGFVPGQLLAHWRLVNEAKAKAAKKAAAVRASATRLKKSEKDEVDRRAEVQAVRDARCPRCFTVKTPAGNCNC